MRIPNWLEHPLARGRDLDDPATTALRRQIIRGKPFLQDIYRDWYRRVAAVLPPKLRPIVELGSGASDPEDTLHPMLRTDILLVPGLDIVLDARRLPFRSDSVGAFVLINVFHHIPDPSEFLSEANRCLMPGGLTVMIEPWMTPWSRLVYQHLHHEMVDLNAGWNLLVGGPLSVANSALPWIVFDRDRERFLKEYPRLEMVGLAPLMPLRYLLSGGVSKRSLMPGWSSPLWKGIEAFLRPLAHHLGMFALIVLRKTAPES